MATYTSNLNLYMPDATDDFGEFREEHNDNMVKIDNAIGGGGGSGGHTIVNPSGTDMPAESKLQFTGGVTVTDDSVNGKTVVDITGGGGNVYGAFIDTNRVLATHNSSGGSAIPSYTALEDCFVAFYVFGKNSQTCRIYVDSAEILTIYFQGDGVQSPTLYLKKGQTLSFSSFDYWSFHYEVYGLTQGTSGIFTPIIYSDTERVVGVWRDNKPLYQRTVHLSSVTSGTAYSHGIANVENISVVNILAKRNTGWFSSGHIFEDSPSNVTESFSVIPNATYLYAYLYGCTISDAYITVQYTKTTDVAGSGNWNTDGVPTVHYSTSEQVIGTFFGKPLYQKSWDLASGILVSYNGWTDTSIDSTNMESIVSVKATHPEGTCYEGIMADPTRQTHTVVGLQTTRNGNDARIQYLTLQYTKVTD